MIKKTQLSIASGCQGLHVTQQQLLLSLRYGWVGVHRDTIFHFANLIKKQLKYYNFLVFYARNISHYTICFQRALRWLISNYFLYLSAWNGCSPNMYLIYLYTELYKTKIFYYIIEYTMNEYICTTIRAGDQSTVARSVKCLSTNREVQGMISQWHQRFFINHLHTEIRRKLSVFTLRILVSLLHTF